MLHCKDPNMNDYMERILRCFFARYDADASGFLNDAEFAFVMRDLGEDMQPADIKRVFDEVDTNHNNELSFKEFCTWAAVYMEETNVKNRLAKQKAKLTMPAYEVEDEEDEEIPDDLADLPPEEQSRRLLQRSIFLMLVGTILVLLFANPAVDVFNEWGVRLGISSFYVSFLLAPFASNASELLVAYGMALKKTSKSVTQSFESLVGAACMNNTLCLAVLYFLIYYKKLVWKFKAETVGILIIQWIMATLIFSSNTQPKFMGFVILALYPLCLVIVWVLENICGWD
jgi:Ca2+/H+ antiporter